MSKAASVKQVQRNSSAYGSDLLKAAGMPSSPGQTGTEERLLQGFLSPQVTQSVTLNLRIQEVVLEQYVYACCKGDISGPAQKFSTLAHYTACTDCVTTEPTCWNGSM